MLKYITYYILILSFFGSQLIKLSIYADFKINQKFISEVFCIDKDKHMSNCNGKCYLYKQLKKQEEKEKNKAPKEVQEKVEVLLLSR